MRLSAIIFVCLLLGSLGSTAYTLSGIYKVNGTGKMTGRTNMVGTSDLVYGLGEQSYTRVVETNSSITTLSSEYQFIGSENASWCPYPDKPYPKKYANKYSVKMASYRGNMAHSIAVSNFSKLNSKCNIVDGDKNLVTKYNITGSGTFNENFIDANVGSGKKIPKLATMELVGEFEVNSSLSSAISSGDDFVVLRSKLDDMRANVSINETFSTLYSPNATVVGEVGNVEGSGTPDDPYRSKDNSPSSAVVGEGGNVEGSGTPEAPFRVVNSSNS